MSDWTKQIFRWLGHGRYRATPLPVGDGQVQELLVDPKGRLRVVFEGPAPTYHRAMLQTVGLAKDTPGDLLELWGFSADAGQDLYLLLVDKEEAPGESDEPLEVIPVPAGKSFAFSPAAPIPFSAGIAWAVSTQPDGVQFPMSDGQIVLTVAYR